jgi:hypothetical protein
MSATYRPSRNIEASFLDYVKDELESVWNDVSVVKTFNAAYTTELPVICIRRGRTSYPRAEIGSTQYVRETLVLIDVFCTSDGQKLDLIDWLVDALKDGLPYYEYVTTKTGRTVTSAKTQNGRIRITNIESSDVNADVERDRLDKVDKFRGLITCTISLGRCE